jgi:sodium-dependent dicarboxylate transporter 2/3/5
MFPRLPPFLAGKKTAVFGILITASLLLLPLPEGLTPAGRKALVLAALSFILFATEAIPLPGVAMLIAILEVAMGLADSSEVARSFANDSVFFIMGSLMIAVALTQQNLDTRIAWMIVRFSGPRVERIVFGIVATSALIGSFMGEHTSAALMLPVGVSLIKFSGKEGHDTKNLSALLMLSIAYGAMISGIGTPSGGARNAIMLSYLYDLFHQRISYGMWTLYAYPMVLIQIPVVSFLLCKTFRPEKTDLSDAILLLEKKIQACNKMGKQDWTALGILGATVLMWMTIGSRIGLGTVALIGVLLFMIAGTVKWEDLNNKVNWGVILIYGGTLSLGIVMKTTGAAEWVAMEIVNNLSRFGFSHGLPFLLAVSLLTALSTSVITTGGTVGILGPIVLNMAQLSGMPVITTGLVTAISSSFSYLTPFSTPVGNILIGTGFLSRRHFLKAGWKIWIFSIVLLLFLASTYWKLFD